MSIAILDQGCGTNGFSTSSNLLNFSRKVFSTSSNQLYFSKKCIFYFVKFALFFHNFNKFSTNEFSSSSNLLDFSANGSNLLHFSTNGFSTSSNQLYFKKNGYSTLSNLHYFSTNFPFHRKFLIDPHKIFDESIKPDHKNSAFIGNESLLNAKF